MQKEQFSNLSERIRGSLITPASGEYEVARRVYNEMIDRRPAAIVRCADVADVKAALNFARQNDYTVAIRGGGHNGAGLGVCDQGLVIDLSLMKGIRVDPAIRTVRVEPGCTQGDVDHASHAFGLAVPAGIVSTTGIAGLTLGGGTGYLTRKYGLTIDNLIEADVVLADGSFAIGNASQNEDLFWALRGGGGNFGVVTSFVFRAHPVSTVYAGPIFWEVKDARRVMQWYREFLPQAPLELCPFLALKSVPSTNPFPKELWGKKICALISCYSGPLERAEEAIKPIRQELPRPILDWMGPMPFPALQGLFDPLLPKGLQWYWKGDFVRELSDKAIDSHLEWSAKAPSELSLMHLYPIDGAVHGVGRSETAWGFRDATWSMVIAGIDADPAKAGALTAWAKGYWEAVHPYTLGGAYVNFLMDEGVDRIKATYRNNYNRLTETKRKYDPHNFFRINQNIKPD
ncbi:MAG: FAD-binding oxidoreductase [Verrucomicrobia bacterium]|nr:FAD-binding oxidoreductase [Verrucomicrobiota bacterium]